MELMILAVIAICVPILAQVAYTFFATDTTSTGSRGMIYIQQITLWPLAVAYTIDSVVDTPWTRKILINSMLFSMIGPFMADWMGILNATIQASIDHTMGVKAVWVAVSAYIACTVGLLAA